VLAIAAAVVLAASLDSAGSAVRSRSVEATYVGTVAPLPDGARRVDVWIPIPSDGPYQTVSDVAVEAPSAYTIGRDSAGNRVAHFALVDPKPGKEVEVRARYKVTRREVRSEAPASALAASGAKDASESDLKENRFVPLTPRVRALAKEIAGSRTDTVAKAKAFYEYLVDNGTYDKTTPGWGRGDSERFCDLKKGNCTDFHSAFLALARAEGIPARFLIGFPLPPAAEGTVPGYHCWTFFRAPEGWIPVDASDAAKLKDPAKKAYLFGNLDADRFDVSSGRDLTLVPPQKDGPVNFLIYPYVEVDGKSFSETKMRLEYRDAAR
jgi:transglutaminase-like putative cysteine protease